MKARVFITLKNGVLDPQGKAIHHALEGLVFVLSLVIVFLGLDLAH